MFSLWKQRRKKGKKSENQLAELNKSAFMARHDAAYDRAVQLFMDDLFSYPAEKRSKVYEVILELLNISINARNSFPYTDDSNEKDPIKQYLYLLKDTIQAAYALATHEMILFQEEEHLSNFIGTDITKQFRSTDEVFSNSEMNIYHSTNELIELAEPSLYRYRERQLKNFNHDDIVRYRKSLKEFTNLYKTYGVNFEDE